MADETAWPPEHMPLSDAEVKVLSDLFEESHFTRLVEEVDRIIAARIKDVADGLCKSTEPWGIAAGIFVDRHYRSDPSRD